MAGLANEIALMQSRISNHSPTILDLNQSRTLIDACLEILNLDFDLNDLLSNEEDEKKLKKTLGNYGFYPPTFRWSNSKYQGKCRWNRSEPFS